MGEKDQCKRGFVDPGKNFETWPNTAKGIAKIGSVTIVGAATGSTNIGEFFGIVAEQIAGLNVGGKKFVLSGAKDSGDLDLVNFNFRYLEV